MTKSGLARFLYITLGGAALFGAGFYAADASHTNPSGLADVYQTNSKYHFINPVLFCSDQNSTNGSVNKIQDSVNTFIASKVASGDISEATVYFRDLNGGPWMLINPDVMSIPASLLKVPTGMVISKHGEQNPGFLQNTITYNISTNVNAVQYFKPGDSLVPGNTYTITQVMQYMLADSDNGALDTLSTLLPQDEFRNAYTDLGIDPPSDLRQYTLDVKTYASFFRVLYYATYLTRDSSESMLGMLSNSSFSQGIKAGIPANVVVAHKFGEFRTDATHAQLHDCGIVYKPRQPYLLCIMTHGADYDKLASVISHISQTVYNGL